MNLTNVITINAYSIIVLIILSIQTLRHSERQSLQYKVYMALLHTTILMLIVDVMGRFDGNPGSYYSIFNQLGNFTLYIINGLLPSLWLLYVYFQFNNRTTKLKPLLYLIAASNFINFIFLISSQFFGWYYYIDESNVYHRGSLFWISVFIACVLLFNGYIIIIKNGRNIEKKIYHALLSFGIPPLIGIFLQTKFYGTPFISNSIALSLLIVFLNIQNQNIYSDYLTGVHNRKKLEMHLQEKIERCKKKQCFSAILLDFDNFKEINDSLGHQTGDDALITGANLLKDCLRPNDFLSRYGGDEFCIVLDISNQEELEKVVERIMMHLEKYNSAKIKPYSISFSMGYSVYDCNLNKGSDAFQKEIDEKMYEVKNSK